MFKSFLEISIPALLVMAGLGISTMTSYAKPEYTKKEKKGCTFCHTAQGKKDLNDVGKCYAEHKALDTCTPKP